MDEKRKRRRSGGKLSRVRRRRLPLHSSFQDPLAAAAAAAAAPLTLAAVVKIESPYARSVVKRRLRLHLELLSRASSSSSPPLPPIILPALLSVLPLLLEARFPSVAALASEVVGAIALWSLEANATIASDVRIVKSLVSALRSPSTRVVAASCNAIMDLSTSPKGKDCLIGSAALENLFSLFCQATYAIDEPIVNYGGSDRIFAQSHPPDLLFDALVVLIGAHSHNDLAQIPEVTVQRYRHVFANLWRDAHLTTASDNSGRELNFLHVRKSDLAGILFKVSMNQPNLGLQCPLEVKRSIFGSGESEFKKFILDHWEVSPKLFAGVLNDLNGGNILDSFFQSLNRDTVESFICSVIGGLFSCPPIASDELNIDHFLDEVKGTLGSPIKYQQDIRVLRTQRPTSSLMHGDIEGELHFFNDELNTLVFSKDCILRCAEAFQGGYSVALRGLEFRFGHVAAVADELANLFGQPTVGANMYITPPGSQGLALHCDDHCVFVCQLYGCKLWRILKHPSTLLPRLYEPFDSSCCSETDACGAIELLLQEGDVLYIPRGFPHESYTTTTGTEHGNSKANDFSLHLTLGIEVESPFQWEGFVHIAFYSWYEEEKESCPAYGMPEAILVSLMHISIRLLSSRSSVLRKACMVGSLLTDLDATHALMSSQEAIFGSVVQEINSSSNFLEAFKTIEMVVEQGSDDPLQWMRWLRHLTRGGIGIDFCNLLHVFKEYLTSPDHNMEEALMGFTMIKTKFSRNVAFEDACRSYKLLLEKYRETRRLYSKGILSLHSLS